MYDAVRSSRSPAQLQSWSPLIMSFVVLAVISVVAAIDLAAW